MTTTDTAPIAETTTAVRSWKGLDVPTPGTFAIDVSHTEVGFVARHLMVTKVRGRFSSFEGAITIADEPTASTVDVTIDAASLDSRDEQRDGHVKSDDFLAVEQFPTLRFRSTKVTHRSGDEFDVEGELTVKDVTRPVTLRLEFGGVEQDPWGGQRLGFSAHTEIDREAFGLTWNVTLESGGVLVGKKVKIEIEGEAVRSA